MPFSQNETKLHQRPIKKKKKNRKDEEKDLVYFEVISFDTKRCIFLLFVITICQGTSFVFSSKK